MELHEDHPSEDREAAFRAALTRAQPPPSVLGRDSKAGRGPGKVCCGRRGGVGCARMAVGPGELGGSLCDSPGSMFDFLCGPCAGCRDEGSWWSLSASGQLWQRV